jgi:hypothetical protein
MRAFAFLTLFCFYALAEKPISAADYVSQRPEIFQPDHPEVLTKLRKEVGDKFAQEVMTYFIKEIVQNRSCDSFIGSCDFYLCQEQKNPCGIKGYNLGFGYKYCSESKYKLIDQMKRPFAKDWVPKAFQCLQTRSFADSTKDCSDIRKRAYKSHPDCYVEAGYCELTIWEKSNIIELIFAKIFSPKAIAQGAKIVNLCAKKIRD